MISRVALFAAAVFWSSTAHAETTPWLKGGAMQLYLNNLKYKVWPTKIACRAEGRTVYLQVTVEPNPRNFMWTWRSNVHNQWKPIKEWHDQRGYFVVSKMEYTAPIVGSRFCAVWHSSRFF